MDYIFIGKYVNTHGIKGEIRIISDFEKKEKVFKIGNDLYLGKNKNKFKIKNYRIHKNYDMVVFENIDSINDIISLKGSNVYFLKKDLHLKPDEYVYEELIAMDVYDNNIYIGKVQDYININSNTLLEIIGEKKFYIPLKSVYIKEIDKKNNKIITNNGSDLIL